MFEFSNDLSRFYLINIEDDLILKITIHSNNGLGILTNYTQNSE